MKSASLLLFLLFLAVPLARSSTPIEIQTSGIRLQANAWNEVNVIGEQGDVLFTFTGFAIKWRPTLLAHSGILQTNTNPDGTKTLEIAYQFPSTATGDKLEVMGQFTPRAGTLDIHYKITGVPKGSDIGGCMFGRRLPQGAETMSLVKLGLWERHEYGGIPMEHSDGRLLPYRINGQLLALAFDSKNKFNPQWADGHHQHTGTHRIGEGTYESRFTLLLPRPEWPFEATAARWHGRPIALHIGTNRDNNWWTDPSEAIELKAIIVNTTQAPRLVEVNNWIQNFSGKIISQNKRTLTLQPEQALPDSFRFTPTNQRDLFFAEVSVTDKESGQEIFARTNLALLPPCTFKSTPADSVIGLSAGTYPYPSEQAMRRIIQRLGVRWLRHGNTHDYENIIAIRHDNVNLKQKRTSSERDDLIRTILQRCIDEGNPAWEFTNEINYASLNIGLGDTLKGTARAETIATYIDWLKAIRRIQREMGATAEKIKILSTGLAGMDVRFVEALHDAGGWELIDGIALHPGRGNFTADYPVYNPSNRTVAWEEWKLGAHGNYWNYYGSVLTAKNLISRYGGNKDLWLTEVYSPGWHNSFWDDSPRNGAENAVLSLALGHAEGVKSVMWYQVYDGVWWDRLGVNPKDREYFFGLIMRDGSFKPSFMAFCATAEALDQAKFKGWLKFPEATNPKTRGLHFDTPRGPMSILWDRSDGYVLTQNTPNFATPEAWADTWKTRTPISLPTTANTIRVLNIIGQEQQATVRNRVLELELTGAPTIVYGLDASSLLK